MEHIGRGPRGDFHHGRPDERHLRQGVRVERSCLLAGAGRRSTEGGGGGEGRREGAHRLTERGEDAYRLTERGVVFSSTERGRRGER